jgi:hypothetical protein
MKVMETHKSIEINETAAKSIDKEAILITDKSTSYEDFSALFDTHVSFKSNAQVTKTALKWAHIAISNAKRNLLGVYHIMHSDYFQNYLNEFCYRLNRRYFGKKLFDRMTIAIVGN